MPSVEARYPAVRRELLRLADPKKARFLRIFFRTGKGEYAEGDVFLGINVPPLRVVARRHRGLPLADVDRLLRSKYHEERLLGLMILVERCKKADAVERGRVFRFYVARADRANNWDLVDLSAPTVVGEHLAASGKSTAILDRLAGSRSLWRRRIAIVATYAFIRRGIFGHTFRIADRLLQDPHDLIHKATGWMLREAGKRDKVELVRYLGPRYRRMPRTMLRYAIERFPETERRAYIEGRA